ncbi:MAG: pseudaminic acid cytidylyltransferase [Lachnospiraceae bacterium]|nr:pseudaminic acid cytidylyltransferase [Lachnospiraceae bacterium]
MKLAIITARGGSKRIPRKNIRNFLGKPILAYSIEAALKSGVFDEVMISTEDAEIAEIAQRLGAVFPFPRSEQTAGDHAVTIDVMLEVAEEYRKRGRDPEVVCCLYPTAPFVTAEKLRSADRLLAESGADAVIPVVRFSYPPQRCFIEQDGLLKYRWPEYEFARSQDLDPYYHDAGQFYFIRTSVMRAEHTLVPGRTAPLILDELEVQDIDTDDDWHIAEMKYQRMQSGGSFRPA